MNFLKRFWPFLFIFFIWFAFASPYFLKNQVPYPSTYQMNHFPPWSQYQQFLGPVKNGAMPDIIDQIYPWRHLSIESWKRGQLPLWNPYSFSGNPHLGNYQSAVFSPVNFLFFLFPFVDAWSIAVLLQPLLAGVFMYLFMRELKISSTGSLISSIAFMFSGFMVVWMAYGTLALAISFLPLSLFAIEKWTNTKKMKYLILLSLTISFSFFSGHFQTSLYFFGFTVCYFLFKTEKEKKNFSLLLLSLSVGLIISLIQIIPSIQLYLDSVRNEIFLKGGGIPWYYLVTLVSPDFFGNPVTRNDWFGYYAEWSSFIGIVPLLFALFGISRKNKTAFFFSIASFVTLLLAVSSPLQDIIGMSKIPVFSTSNPSRIVVLFSLSLAVLSGFGFDFLRKQESWKKLKNILFSVGMVFLLIWASLLLFKVMPLDKILIAKRNFFLPTILFGVTCLVVFVSIFLKKDKKTALLLLLLLFTTFDSFRFAQKWMPFDPKTLVFPNTGVIDGIKQNIGQGRIFGNLGAQVEDYYGFPGIEGYDPLYIQRYGEFIQSASSGGYEEALRSVVKLSRVSQHTNRVLDLLGVSLIFHPVADTNQSWAYPVWKDTKRFSLVYNDGIFQLFKNNEALKRASLFYNYEVITDKKQSLLSFYDDNFDFRKTIILEEDPHVRMDSKASGSAEFVSYTSDSIVVKVSSSAEGLLFLSDTYYPSWKVKVNGKESKIYQADYAFRAVTVPKGKSMVEFFINSPF